MEMALRYLHTPLTRIGEGAQEGFFTSCCGGYFRAACSPTGSCLSPDVYGVRGATAAPYSRAFVLCTVALAGQPRPPDQVLFLFCCSEHTGEHTAPLGRVGLVLAGLFLSLLVGCGEGAAVLSVHGGTAQMGCFLGCVLHGLGFQPWLSAA